MRQNVKKVKIALIVKINFYLSNTRNIVYKTHSHNVDSLDFAFSAVISYFSWQILNRHFLAKNCKTDAAKVEIKGLVATLEKYTRR